MKQEPADAPYPSRSAATSRRINLPTLATIAAVVAIIYFAQAIVLPLAIAMLLTFALSPVADRFRKLGIPNIPAVLLVTAGAFSAVALFVLVVAGQLSSLSASLPEFQANIIAKVDAIRAASSETGLIRRFSDMLATINAEIGTAGEDPAASSRTPMPVEVIERQNIIGMVSSLILPLVSPIATAGLVVVIVIFMLLERAELRDRFIKLIGSDDLHRTTQVMQEAGGRVGRYLLVLFTVNVIYAVPVGVGLWLIGVPNALLWGLLTLVLRFVPYIGTILSAAFPLFLAFAVSPDWTAVLWTITLFATVELVTSNVIEPWLYGSRTGVSPLAIIVSAIFWTWLWGPLGLIISTPLTVCLVVLGKHLPQFAVFDILFGDEPVLAPHSRLYQRLLAGDVVEATTRAHEALEDAYIGEYYRDVGIPALLIAQYDSQRGVLSRDQQNRLVEVATLMVNNLTDLAESEEEETDKDDERPGHGFRILCVGGRSDIDDVSALMLSQTLRADGASSRQVSHGDLLRKRFRDAETAKFDCLILSFTDPSPSRASLLHIRRIKQAAPHLRVGVAIWAMEGDAELRSDPAVRGAFAVTNEKLEEARTVGADFAVKTFEDLISESFKSERPIALPASSSRMHRAAFRNHN